MAGKSGGIYAGIGGWNFAPWRGVFYPKGLPHAQELRYAAQHLTSIEINGTFYGTQKPASYRKWASEVPDGFVFSLKGPRFAINRRVLAEAGGFDQALSEFRHHRARRPARAAAVAIRADQEISTRRISANSSNCCPPKFDGHTLRHVVEVRHDSFCTSGLHQAAATVRYPGRVRGARDLSGDRRHHRRFRLCASAEGRGKAEDRLSAKGARRMGEAREELGGRRRAGRT